MVAPTASWMPIGELSRRVGMSPDLLRKWERRYGVLSPGRSTGNQRLYSRVDEARLQVMLGHVREGVPAAQAAELAVAARFKLTAQAPTVAAVERSTQTRRALRDALLRYDETGGDQALAPLLAAKTVSTVIRAVLLPLMRGLDAPDADPPADPAQVRFAAGFVHTRLLHWSRGWDRGLGPRVLLACPPGETHTLGLIAFGMALHSTGWRVTYLGADTPASSIAAAAAALRPRLVVVAASLTRPLEIALHDLGGLRARWPLALAGPAASAGLAAECGASHLTGDPFRAAETVM